MSLLHIFVGYNGGPTKKESSFGDGVRSPLGLDRFGCQAARCERVLWWGLIKHLPVSLSFVPRRVDSGKGLGPAYASLYWLPC